MTTKLNKDEVAYIKCMYSYYINSYMHISYKEDVIADLAIFKILQVMLKHKAKLSDYVKNTKLHIDCTYL